MSNNPSQVIKLFGKTIIQQVDNKESISTRTTSLSSSTTTTSLEADQEASTAMEKAGGGGGSKSAVISCPRCKSKETKFCYFNNYNVNQPRHFCKSCRRYWTAGGTLRTVPVGAGRRNNRALHRDGEPGSTCLGLDHQDFN